MNFLMPSFYEQKHLLYNMFTFLTGKYLNEVIKILLDDFRRILVLRMVKKWGQVPVLAPDMVQIPLQFYQ